MVKKATEVLQANQEQKEIQEKKDEQDDKAKEGEKVNLRLKIISRVYLHMAFSNKSIFCWLTGDKGDMGRTGPKVRNVIN